MLTVSAVVITYLRADFVMRCVQHLLAQSEPADQIIVVDASPDDVTERALASYAGVTYLKNPAGAGNMTNSRNAALEVVTGDIVAFLDDDAFPEPAYLERLRELYQDPSVGLACARTLNGQPAEATEGVDAIGKFLPDGSLTGNFAADPGKPVDIDHGIGATMSFRRSTIADLGSFREDYRGISGVREDADAFFRARMLGHRAMFAPAAVASHVAAPQAKGRRFDLRYHHWFHRNHMILLVNNFGATSPLLRRHAVASARWTLAQRERSLPSRVVRLLAAESGLIRGLAFCLARQRGRRLEPAATDFRSERLRARLRGLPSVAG